MKKKIEFPYNKTIYYRASHDEKHPYTMISNTLIKDNRLSILEKGLMIYLLSNSDKYVINKSVILRDSGHGRKAIDNAFKNLKELNYIAYMYNKNVHTWIINEYPEYCSQSDSTNVTAEHCGDFSNRTNVIPEKCNNLIDSTIVTSQLEQVININETNINEANTNEANTKEEITKEEISNLKDKNAMQFVENDLNLILLNSSKFKAIYNTNSWWKINISNFSNSAIV